MVSEEFYQSLPEDLREMFVRYMQKAADMEREQLEQEDAQYLDTIATTCEITLLTEEQRQAFQDACEPVYDWFATEYPELDLQAYMDAVAAPTT